MRVILHTLIGPHACDFACWLVHIHVILHIDWSACVSLLDQLGYCQIFDPRFIPFFHLFDWLGFNWFRSLSTSNLIGSLHYLSTALCTCQSFLLSILFFLVLVCESYYVSLLYLLDYHIYCRCPYLTFLVTLTLVRRLVFPFILLSVRTLHRFITFIDSGGSSDHYYSY